MLLLPYYNDFVHTAEVLRPHDIPQTPLKSGADTVNEKQVFSNLFFLLFLLIIPMS